MTVDPNGPDQAALDALADAARAALEELVVVAKAHAAARHALVAAVVRTDYPTAAVIQADLGVHIRHGEYPHLEKLLDSAGGSLWSVHRDGPFPNEDVPVMLADALTALEPSEAGWVHAPHPMNRYTLQLPDPPTP